MFANAIFIYSLLPTQIRIYSILRLEYLFSMRRSCCCSQRVQIPANIMAESALLSMLFIFQDRCVRHPHLTCTYVVRTGTHTDRHTHKRLFVFTWPLEKGRDRVEWLADQMTMSSMCSARPFWLCACASASRLHSLFSCIFPLLALMRAWNKHKGRAHKKLHSG